MATSSGYCTLPTTTLLATKCSGAMASSQGRAHPIGDAVSPIRAYAAASPFVVSSVVVGNVQYPEEVAMAVSRKLALTQDLQRKDTEIEIERKERTKREVQAEGIANAMLIIRGS